MNAIHTVWTRPKTASGRFEIEDFELLTIMLSALKWREKNGDITLVTDSLGYRFFKERGMLSLWNKASRELDEIPNTVNSQTFWAAGKLYALKNASTPVAIIDTDFIVWDRLAFDNMEMLTVIHNEEINPQIYPDINEFKMKRGYVFNPDLDWHINPVNAAFYVLKDETLKACYTNEAITFMENCEGSDPLTNMVFCEQRLLAMCSKMCETPVLCLSNIKRLFDDGERYFTHLWGMKQQMREDASLRRDFCLRCIDRLKRDFPETDVIIKNIPELTEYI